MREKSKPLFEATQREIELGVVRHVLGEVEPHVVLGVEVEVGLRLPLHAVLLHVGDGLLALAHDGVLHPGEVLLRLLLEQLLLHLDAEDGLGALRIGDGAHELGFLADLVGALLLGRHQLFRPLHFYLQEKKICF